MKNVDLDEQFDFYVDKLGQEIYLHVSLSENSEDVKLFALMKCLKIFSAHHKSKQGYVLEEFYKMLTGRHFRDLNNER